MEHPIDLPSVRLQESNAESTTQTMTCAEEPKSCDQHMHEDSEHIDAEIENSEVLDNGSLQYGCPHYRRRRRIRAPYCNEIFYCHHCHNEAKLCKIQIKNDINVDQKERHTIPHHEVQQVICTLCGTEQEVQQMCANCGVCMAKYFCGTCKLFDDDISKRQFHCDGCGICRLGLTSQTKYLE